MDSVQCDCLRFSRIVDGTTVTVPQQTPTPTTTLIVTATRVPTATLAVTSTLAPSPSLPTPTAIQWRAEQIRVGNERPIDPSGNAIFLGWSPDGSKFLYRKIKIEYILERLQNPKGANWYGLVGDLWVANADGTNRRRLTGTAASWAWSPDSKYVAYSTPLQQEGFQGSLIIVDTAASLPLTLTTSTIAWFQDIYWLSTNEIVFLKSGGIYAIKTDGSGERRVNNLSLSTPLSGGAVNYYSVSPNGKKFAYRGGGLAGPMAWLANLDGTGAKQFSEKLGGYWVWAPDSTKLAYITLNSYPGTGYDTDLWTVNADGTNPSQIVKHETLDELNISPAWSLDSQVITFIKRPVVTYDARSGLPPPVSRNDVWVVNRDGSNMRRLIENVTQSELHWSPKGKTIAITRAITDKVDYTPATVNSLFVDATQ